MVAVNQENLLGELIPDVYIRKVTLETSGTPNTESNPHIDHEREILPPKLEKDADALIITLDLLMKEKLDNDLIGTWFANQDLEKYLQIKVFQSTDPKTTALFSAGADLLDLADSSKSVSVDDPRMKLAAVVYGVNSAEEVFERIDKRVISRKMPASKQGNPVTPKITQYKESVDSDGNRVFDISFTQRFELSTSNPEHLAYFAVTSLDLEALAQDFDIDLDSIGLKDANGKVASDLVIDDFSIVNQTFSFLDNRGKIWAGSVHRLPNGQFRSGAKETENSTNLTRFSVTNTKLQDFRDVKEIEKLMLDFGAIENNSLSKNLTKILTNDSTDVNSCPTYFSEMLLSRDKDGDSKFFFTLDFERMIQENAVFGPLFASSNDRLKKSMMRNTQIRSMRVLRRRAKKIEGLNRLGSPRSAGVFDTNEPLELIACSSEPSWKRFAHTRFTTGTLKELDVVMEEGAPLTRHFTGMDFGMSELTDGLYQYVVEIEVDDATVEFFIDKMKNLLGAKTALERYLSDGSKPAMSRYLDEIRDPHIEHPSEFAGTSGKTAGSFDVASNRFTQNFIETQRARFKGPRQKFAPWIEPIAVYADVLDMFTSALANRGERQRLLKSLYSYVAPDTGNPNGIATVIKLIDTLIHSLSSVAGITVSTSRRFDGTTVSTLQSPVLNTGRSPRKTFKVVKSFEQTFDSNVIKSVGLDYLSRGEDDTANDDGLKTIDNSDFQGRVDQETERFFIATEPSIDVSFGNTQITENDSIKKTNFSFLSPTRVDFLKNSVVLTEERTVATPGKERISRFTKNIGDGEVKAEDQATEVITNILVSNVTSAPTSLQTKRTSGARTSKQKNRTDIEMNEEAIRGGLGAFLAADINLTTRPIKVRVRKDLDGYSIVEPEPTPTQPESISNCATPPNDPEEIAGSQDDIGIWVEPDRVPVNQFFGQMAGPAASNGIGARAKRNAPTLLSNIDLRNLTTSGTGESKRISGLKEVVTEEEIKSLPNQMKALLLLGSAQNVVKTSKMRGITTLDASEKNKFAAATTLDFEMLVKVEYFAGFERGENNETLVKKPIWRTLTDEKNNSLVGKDILCRIAPYENKKFGISPKKGLKTGIYDEYFVLTPKFKEISTNDAAPASLDDNQIVKTILDELGLNFPSVDVSRVAIPPPANSVNEPPTSSGRVLPVGIKIVERFPNGRTLETDLVVKGGNLGNVPDPRDSLDDDLGLDPTIAVELLATDIQTKNVEDEFTSNNVVVQTSFEEEINRILTGVKISESILPAPDGALTTIAAPDSGTGVSIDDPTNDTTLSRLVKKSRF